MEQILHKRTVKGAVFDLKISEPYIYADREKEGRSGHMGHAMCEFSPGKIIDFSSNTSGVRFGGHSSYGFTEYRISEDYGETFGEVRVLPVSKKALDDGIETIIVEKCVSVGGVITAFLLSCSQFRPICCEPFGHPSYVRSFDGGKTWTDPVRLCDFRGRVYDSQVYDGKIYVLLHCNDAEVSFTGNLPEHVYRLYESTDGGESFKEKCVVPFPETDGRAYGNLQFRENGDLIVYCYNVNDEVNMDYVITHDFGKTWDKPGKSYVKKRVRNPQTALLDGQYILHARAGENEHGVGKFVIYTSRDGINWDDGTILIEGRRSCFYSNSIVINENGKNKLLVQYSENIKLSKPEDEWTSQVNVMHLTIRSLMQKMK